jgi:spore coat protein CotH
MPFKLDFDEFEDDFPEVKDQRFHGFRQLSLANGFGDATFMREAIVYDLLEESGLVAAETGFYEVFLDRGEGRTSLGLYTVIEVIDDTVVGRYFEDASGAIYEGDGPAASLAAGTRERIRDSFLRESKDGDWSEILALYDALHSAQRTSNPAAWRRGLEAVFDVASFLKWLALSAVIQHWDTYGAMTHNFYLYQDPGARRLNWISWDHNEVLRPSPAAGGGANAANLPAGGPDNAGRIGGRNVTLDKREVGANWPLIRFLLDDPTYNSAYVGYLRETIEGVFRPERMEARYAQAASRLEPYAGNGQAYRSAVASLLQVTRERHAAVRAFLDSL